MAGLTRKENASKWLDRKLANQLKEMELSLRTIGGENAWIVAWIGSSILLSLCVLMARQLWEILTRTGARDGLAVVSFRLIPSAIPKSDDVMEDVALCGG